jgi:hypothetical protein
MRVMKSDRRDMRAALLAIYRNAIKSWNRAGTVRVWLFTTSFSDPWQRDSSKISYTEILPCVLSFLPLPLLRR